MSHSPTTTTAITTTHHGKEHVFINFVCFFKREKNAISNNLNIFLLINIISFFSLLIIHRDDDGAIVQDVGGGCNREYWAIVMIEAHKC
ncbi:transmembrane protein, putative [Medicago truncatula]|uniref:Transmembrane protein, putative n=1 Tax=Medicago truncatula TaxID=3880 RepID=G7IFK3_MEDTR|nr:transmembrane protein, putative [Medicago truncatula]